MSKFFHWAALLMAVLFFLGLFCLAALLYEWQVTRLTPTVGKILSAVEAGVLIFACFAYYFWHKQRRLIIIVWCCIVASIFLSFLGWLGGRDTLLMFARKNLNRAEWEANLRHQLAVHEHSIKEIKKILREQEKAFNLDLLKHVDWEEYEKATREQVLDSVSRAKRRLYSRQLEYLLAEARYEDERPMVRVLLWSLAGCLLVVALGTWRSIRFISFCGEVFHEHLSLRELLSDPAYFDLYNVEIAKLGRLHQAAARGDLAKVERQLRKGADANAKDEDDNTPLHMAAYWGYNEIVAYLVSKGANINVANKKGKTPLHIAAYRGHKQTAAYLISNGADVNAADNYGKTPLHEAVYWGHNETVAYLVSKGADVNATDKDGNTPLHFAVLEGHTRVAALLRQHGAKQ